MIRSSVVLRRWRSSGLLGLAICLVLVAILVATRPGSVHAQRTTVDVPMGETASARAFEVKATRVSVGTAAVTASGRQIRTDHRLVVVEVEAAVGEQHNSLTTVLVTRDGHEYLPRSEFSSAGPTSTPAGFTCGYTVVFEVPTARVTGARLLLDDVRGFQVHHEAVRVDLGLTDDVALSGGPIVVTDADVRVTR